MVPRMRFFLVMAMLLVLVPAPAMVVSARDLSVPVVYEPAAAGFAVVDGDDSEWTANDLYAPMYEQGDTSKAHVGDFYARYDCSEQTLYVLVRSLDTFPIDTLAAPGSEHWIKIEGTKVVHDGVGDDGVPPDFAWVGYNPANETALGWEASVKLDPAQYGSNILLEVHTIFFAKERGQTSRVPTADAGLLLACLEYGDLPDESTPGEHPNYNITRLKDNGGRHLVGSLYLGPTVDAESDGQASYECVGDDIGRAVDDEDGIFPIDLLNWKKGSGGGTLRVIVTSDQPAVYSQGRLYGWIDWGYDGSLVGGAYDSGDKVFDGLDLALGTHDLLIDIPDIPTLDLDNAILYARFRLYVVPGQGPATAARAAMSVDSAQITTDSYAPTGSATNGEVEDYRWSTNPTLAVLSSFAVEAQHGANLVTWETSSELDSLGYNVQRAESAEGPWIQVNAERIRAVAEGQIVGASYEFLDTSVVPGKPYYYRLEVVGFDGRSAYYGQEIGTPLMPAVPSGPFRVFLPHVAK